MNEPETGCEPIDLLADEFIERFRRGERPSLSEYSARHPELAEEIRELFPTLVAMEACGPTSGLFRPAREPELPSHLGDYRILREIGRGGMGVVYEAVQESLGRQVALKVLSDHRLSQPTYRERFRREARAAGKLHHTNIVPVFGVGHHEGAHYFAMQFIEGRSLDAVLNELRRIRGAQGRGLTEAAPGRLADNPLASIAGGLITGQVLGREAVGGDSDSTGATLQPPIAEYTSGVALVLQAPSVTSGSAEWTSQPASRYFRSVAAVGVQVAEALEHAHRQGIQHRDIKPSNLLLDTRGVAWVTDFGLAKAEGVDDLTSPGDIVGTLRYMAPERFQGQSLPAGDIYSLGITLYELLTLRPAFDDSHRGRLIERVTRDDPPPPRKLDPHIPHDLETIVLKAIAKEPSRRYASAVELAEDLGRFLANRPIRARPIPTWELAVKWAKRRPAVAALTAVVTSLLLSVTVGSIVAAFVFGRMATRERTAALNERLARTEAVRAQKAAVDSARESHRSLVRLTTANGTRLVEDGDFFGSLPWFAEALRLDESDALRQEMHRRRVAAALRQSPRLVHILFADGDVGFASFSPDGRHVAMSGTDNCARVFDFSTGRLVSGLIRHNGWVGPARFSPDGRRILTSCTDCCARVWNASTGELVLPPIQHQSYVTDAQFDPAGRRIVTACDDGTARLWNAETGESLAGPLQHAAAVFWAEFSRDGQRIATASNDGTARVWNAATGAPLCPPLRHAARVNRAVFHPNGREVLTASGDGTARVWDVETGRQRDPVLFHGAAVHRAAYSPDGTRIVTACDDGTARIWQASSGTTATPPLTHRGPVGHAEFSPDSRYLVTASADATARVWDARTGRPITPPLKHTKLVSLASFDATGRFVVTTSEDGTARIWDLAASLEAPSPFERNAPVRYLAWSPDGACALIRDAHGVARIWDTMTLEPRSGSVRHGEMVHAAAFSPDGKRIVTAGADRIARLRETSSLREFGPAMEHEAPVVIVAFSPDGRHVLTVTQSGAVRVWGAVTAKPVTEPLETSIEIHQAGFSPDSRRVFAAGRDERVRILDLDSSPQRAPLVMASKLIHPRSFRPDGGRFLNVNKFMLEIRDAESGREVAGPLPHAWHIQAATYSPDGRRILTACSDKCARVWDAGSLRLVFPPIEHDHWVMDAAFSPDGRRIITASLDKTARVWDSSNGAPITPPMRHDGWVIQAAFSPDGLLVATASRDGTARVWDAATGEPVTGPLVHGQVDTDVRIPLTLAFSPDGRWIVVNDARAWELRSDHRPTQDLRLLAHVLASHEIDATNGYVPLKGPAIRDAWQRLQAAYPHEFTPERRSANTRQTWLSEQWTYVLRAAKALTPAAPRAEAPRR